VTRLDDAHVLVTGGSSGIGLETARAALARGARVSIVARDPTRLRRAADELGQCVEDPARVGAEAADVTDASGLEAAISRLAGRLGPVDVLVTSAGAARPGHFETLPAAVFEEQMALDYFGTLHAIRGVVPSMIDRRRGHLLLVSSTAGLVGVYGYSAYSPAKFAVRGLAETLRAELKPFDIRVGCAYPPDTDTPGLARENLEKPSATARISAAVKVRSAAAVAAAIVRGIERDRLVVTADPGTAILARAAGLLGPYLRASFDRHVRRAASSSEGSPG
jgi:3-dehydrosphinganine reductase